MPDLERAVAALARRVQALEDELAIHKVIARYGPTVDAGDGAGAAAVFTDDGVYDVDVRRDGETRRGPGHDRRGSPSGDGWPLRTSDGTGHRHPGRRPRAPKPSALSSTILLTFSGGATPTATWGLKFLPLPSGT